jgi:hypothetical protein
MFIEYNPNPRGKSVGDCVVRAISKAMDIPWDDAYMRLFTHGYFLKDMPTANDVWGRFLIDNDYKRRIIPDTCPDCYTIREFASDHVKGTYILGTGTHVVTVVDGDYYDSWDSGSEVPIYYFEKENQDG